jgi:hypothetical protein
MGRRVGGPYLSTTLRAQGVLLTQYYWYRHNSATDNIAQIFGQASNAMTRSDCPTYAPMSVPTLAGQLTAAGKTWKDYMEE